MSNTYRASLVIDFDMKELEEFLGRELTTEERKEYVLETFVEDIHTFVRDNSIYEIVDVEEIP
jgi:hypothetical protein